MKTMHPCYRQILTLLLDKFESCNASTANLQSPSHFLLEPDEDIAIINLSGESPSNLVHWSCTMPEQ